MELENKVAVVTGGARDIGRAIALALAAQGARVVINYCHSDEEAGRTEAKIKSLGGVVSLCQADLMDAAGAERLVEHAVSFSGNKVDILVNNTGGLVGRKKVEEMDEAFFDEVMNLNFKSLFLVTRAFIPLMKGSSSIINISSQAARDGGGHGATIYGAAKGAVSSFTRGLAKELGPFGIRVNSICPGLIATSLPDRFTAPEVRKQVVAVMPLRREGTADDVANLVAFLASDRASFITGVNYDINGGMLFS